MGISCALHWTRFFLTTVLGWITLTSALEERNVRALGTNISKHAKSRLLVAVDGVRTSQEIFPADDRCALPWPGTQFSCNAEAYGIGGLSP